ncbi:aldehyde dehydrogenase family protein [Trinickia caryophylli]|uniref:Aldehyde dehydrogenase (NAD+) n=1 Tax=Trinickia caryophylli TaxID=28094 RepID=A0A1X7D216_TRICW|nr:aldehyde dehydrogenase family protein [Trinickia caryophylli]PMS12810.1 aldehyde dehydrogenase [Trinickia caryophylli]TRX15228.1 aldehyde dehydrogenase [Trinickia caryophylli]WQE15101.1 aldehyde dehydrogenase family protein [Trinickia caryophylli]SMF07284.1 aldehyde dehydrogenase (NAD+) [Trinickia caryophylli]GLU31164.1 aldehyde dehydrogenase [Trinickia caryophylli]
MKSFDPAGVSVRGAHFIGGEYVEPGGLRLEVKRPSDGAAYAAVPVGDSATVNEAVECAWRTWRASGWGRMAPRERARVLRRFADLVAADAPTLAPLEALGSTRPVRDAFAWDVPFTAEGIRFFAEFADKLGGQVAATDHDHLGMTIAEPYGVVGAIAPWNFPLVMASWKIAPALAAGNAVVLKPSELTPFSVLRLAELAVEAGVPAGLFNVVQGDGRTTGDALVRHPLIGKVTFTGSTRTGAAIMAACAESGTKPVTLELGGKSPQIVFADAPRLDDVARRIAAAITNNAGQVCVAGSRLLVERRIAEPLAERIAKCFATLEAGPTWHERTTLAPIVSQRQAATIETIVDETLAAGASLRYGGCRAECDTTGGAYYAPTLIADVTPESAAVRREIFGPVLTLQSFDTEEEALALAQHPEYGLAAGVHTADIGRALRFVRGLEAGTVWVNRYGRSADFAIPTGGYKRSGIGKDLGREAYEANLRFKSVLIDLNG